MNDSKSNRKIDRIIIWNWNVTNEMNFEKRLKHVAQDIRCYRAVNVWFGNFWRSQHFEDWISAGFRTCKSIKWFSHIFFLSWPVSYHFLYAIWYKLLQIYFLEFMFFFLATVFFIYKKKNYSNVFRNKNLNINSNNFFFSLWIFIFSNTPRLLYFSTSPIACSLRFLASTQQKKW